MILQPNEVLCLKLNIFNLAFMRTILSYRDMFPTKYIVSGILGTITIACFYIIEEKIMDDYANVVIYGLMILSLLSHSAISLDRWVKVKYYSRYEEILTAKRLMIWSPFHWIISFLVPLVYEYFATGTFGFEYYGLFNLFAITSRK